MINSLESWLEAASELFASQSKKLDLFHERQIYSEYWVQSELATLLPWDQPGIYLVDCGAPLVFLAGKDRYPDFILRFDTSTESPLYFIELKDLLTNASKNAKSLELETAVMAQMNQEATKGRWGKHDGKAAKYADSMVEALDTAPIVFCGLAVGTVTDMPDKMNGFNVTKIPIDEKWQIGIYKLVSRSSFTGHADSVNHKAIEQEGFISTETNIADVLLQGILETAKECEDGKCQTAAELPINTLIEAQLLAAQIELQLRDNTQNGLPTIRHAKPWVWTVQSTGSAMTESGRNAGIEIRFSYYNTAIR